MSSSPSASSTKWLVLIAVGVSSFMGALDGSVVNIVLPVILKDFRASVATLEWIVIVYLLLAGGLLLTFGRLGDLYGHRRIFLSGFLVFVLASAACGMAPGAGWLILFRAVQAVGSAMLSANAPAILTKSFPAAQRGQALGMQATMTYLGLTVGPTLGGWLTGQFTWRAVFYINVPVGALALLLGFLFVPRDGAEGENERFDLRGAGLFMAGLTMVLLALNQGGAWGWGSPLTLGFLVAGLAVLAAFVRLELHVQAPMLDLSLFDSRLFSGSAASAVLNYMCVFGITFLMPFYLLQGRGMTPAHAGLVLSAQPLVMAVTAPISGWLSDRFGTRIPGTLGMALLAAGLFLLSGLSQAEPVWQVALALAIAGLGIGIFVSPNNSALMGSAPRERQGIAAGILATARSVGMVLGYGMAGAIFTTVLNGQPPEAGPLLFAAVRAAFLGALIVAGIGTGVTALRE